MDFFIIAIILVVIWATAWKGYALWKAAHNKQRRWFIAILILNTAGILEIVYLKFFQEEKNKNKPR